MSQRVIDILEVIEIEIVDGERTGAASGASEGQLQPFDKGRSIGKSGQEIGSRERRDLVSRRLALGDIGEDALDGDKSVLLVAYRVSTSFEPGMGTVRLVEAHFHQSGIRLTVRERYDAGRDSGMLFAVEVLQPSLRRRQQFIGLVAVSPNILREVDQLEGFLRAQAVKDGRTAFDDAVGIRELLQAARVDNRRANQLRQRLERIDLAR